MTKFFQKSQTILGLSTIILGGIGLGFSGGIKAEAQSVPNYRGYYYIPVDFTCKNDDVVNSDCMIGYGMEPFHLQKKITGLIVDIKHGGGRVNSWVDSDINMRNADGIVRSYSIFKQLNVGRYGYNRTGNFVNLETPNTNGTYGIQLNIRANSTQPSTTMWKDSIVTGTIWVEFKQP